ncbi:MAG TPA: RNA polymerase sigma factor [Anaerolineales bacterium]|nr:RNA polymerase sigma factor [Anaerolineales bacterium]
MTQDFSTRELVLRLQAGELQALGALYDRHQNLVFRTALAITGDRESAADLLQDVFLRFHRFIDRVDPERPLEPWLYRMTANLACTWVKRQRWMRPIEELADWLAGDGKESPSRQAENAETWGALEKALKRLPLSQRTVLAMFYINGLALQEISEILEIPIGTIKSRLHYGRNALKAEMEIQTNPVPEVGYEFT